MRTTHESPLVAGVDSARKEFHEYLRRLLQAGFGKRLMFGSDQMNWPEAMALAIEGIDSAPDESREARHFYNNAARFLRMEGASK